MFGLTTDDGCGLREGPVGVAGGAVMGPVSALRGPTAFVNIAADGQTNNSGFRQFFKARVVGLLDPAECKMGPVERWARASPSARATSARGEDVVVEVVTLDWVKRRSANGSRSAAHGLDEAILPPPPRTIPRALWRHAIRPVRGRPCRRGTSRRTY